MNTRITKFCLVFLLLLMSSSSYAFDPWTKRDIALEATYTALHVIDWGQSRYIADHTDRFHETNPILGRYPSKTKIDIYFPIALALHAGVTHILPQKYRWVWQSITIGVETGYVVNNFNLGLKIDF